jgi:glycosyltransferase involved in cell wall biosynthesis
MVFAICAELNAHGHNFYCIGYCHAISLDEYYAPLNHFEPLIERFVAVSRECLKGLAEHLVSKSSRICLLETPVAIPSLQPKSKSSGVIRIIYAGRMIQQQKRILDFIELIRALENIGLNYQFVLVGSGPDLNLFREQLNMKVHGCPVQAIGALTHRETLERFSESDVFVQVSEYEGMSVSLLEAMAHGAVPVITNAGSGVQGVVDNGVNGFVLNVGDMRSMAARIAFLADNLTQFQEMRMKAYTKAMEFSIDNYVKKFRVMLDEVCAASVRQWPVGRSLLFPGLQVGIFNPKTFWRSPVYWLKRHMRAVLK